MATTANARTRLLVFQCQGCNRGVLVVEERDDTESEFAPIHWWPSPEVEFELPESIPTEVLDSCAEAGRCLGVNAPNGAATMLRNTIALIVNDKGSDEAKTKGTLHKRIVQMVAEGALFADFGDWAHHVRMTGNAGAHLDDYEPVKLDQARELFLFTRELINFLYVQPARRESARGALKRQRD